MSTVIVEALVKNLTEGSVAFQYIKSAGAVRNAVGTLNLDLIPEADRPASATPTDGQWINYYDLESKDWRKFNRDKVVTA